MTFACTNYDYNTDQCQRLKTECIPGRPGCVLEGRVHLSEELQKRVDGAARGSGRRRKTTGRNRR